MFVARSSWAQRGSPSRQQLLKLTAPVSRQQSSVILVIRCPLYFWRFLQIDPQITLEGSEFGVWWLDGVPHYFDLRKMIRFKLKRVLLCTGRRDPTECSVFLQEASWLASCLTTLVGGRRPAVSCCSLLPQWWVSEINRIIVMTPEQGYTFILSF